MIRPFNIDKNGKKADFICDEHGGSVEKLKLDTKTKRVRNNPDIEDEDVVIVDGVELTPPCRCSTTFPTWDDRNKIGKAIGEARPPDA